ncbi:hypothetical protein ACFV8E_02300 [Streptomyces sp. NPDC059849]|uniref:hypothetical protein n=1 Tax=Streptomyces sp. NPDC059849 TaxID=3346969 RepID=UPI0036531D4F
MGDVLLALSIPVLLFACGIYAACESWWRRRHPAPPRPGRPGHRAARQAESAMLVDAEEVVDTAFTGLDGLYDTPEAPATEAPDIRPPATEAPDARPPSTKAPDDGVRRRAASSRDPGRSAPAPRRRG